MYKCKIFFFLVSLINAVWTLINHPVIDWGQSVRRDDRAHSKPGFIGRWYLEGAL